MHLYQVNSQEQIIIRERSSSMQGEVRRAGSALDSGRARKALSELTDNRLIAQLEKLRGEEQAVQLEILHYLNELERRRLYLPRGYSSLFEFCTEHLKYSKPAAMRRINAARCIERVPRVARLLLSGRLSLTAISMISKILTRENASEVLSQAIGRSTREIDILVSRHKPGEKTRDRVKPVCVMTPVKSSKPASALIPVNSKAPSKCQADLTFSSGAGTKCKANLTSEDNNLHDIKPDTGIASKRTGAESEELERVVIEQMFKLEFMVKADFMKKVERLKSLLSNSYPKGLGFEKLFELLMDDYLERNAPESRAKRREKRNKNKNPGKKACHAKMRKHSGNQDKKSRQGSSASASLRKKKDCDRESRHIPKALQDKVYTRDKGRCAYVGQDGKRCNSKRNLQIDHIVPYARGGKHTLGNLRLLCAKHNKLEAERIFGKEFMKRYALRE